MKKLYLVGNYLVIAYAIIPVLWIVSLSLKSPAFVKDGRFIPREITLANYRAIFRNEFFTRALVNSLGIGLIATAFAIIIGLCAAYVLVRSELKWRFLITGAVMVVAMFPQISLVTPLFNIERSLGLFNTWVGLIVPYIAFGLPLAILTLSSFLGQLPPDLERAAYMDGANFWQCLVRIIIPLLGPGLATAGILVFISCWNDLLLAVSLTATPAAQTAPVAIVSFTGSSQFEEPTCSIAAAAVVITAPIIIFVILFQRKIVTGLTSGAVKG